MHNVKVDVRIVEDPMATVWDGGPIFVAFVM